MTEIDYERTKAARLAAAPQAGLDVAELEARVETIAAGAQARGADYVSMRRLLEAAGVGGSLRERARAHLIRWQPDRSVPPLWWVGLRSDGDTER